MQLRLADVLELELAIKPTGCLLNASKLVMSLMYEKCCSCVFSSVLEQL